MLKQILTYFILFTSFSVFSAEKAKVFDVIYFIDTTKTFVPTAEIAIDFEYHVNKKIEENEQAWFVVDVEGGIEDEKCVLLFYSGGAHFWIEDLDKKTIKRIKFKNQISESEMIFDIDDLYRLKGTEKSDNVILTNHKLLPLQVSAKQKIRIWGRINKANYNSGGLNDWRTVRFLSYEKIRQSELLNASKFLFFLGSSIILILISSVLSFKGILEGILFYVFLCIFNIIFLSGYYPLGGVFANWLTEYLIPHHLFLPIALTFNFLFLVKILKIKSSFFRYVGYFNLVVILILVLTYFLSGKNASVYNAVLAKVNLILISGFNLFFLYVVFKVKEERKTFLLIGAGASIVGSIFTLLMHGDLFFSVDIGTYDMLMLGYFVEQCFFLLAIIKFFEVQMFERISLKAKLEIEQERVGELAKEAFQFKLAQTEKQQAVALAIEKLKSIEEISDDEMHSNEVLKTITILNKHSKDSTLFDSVKILIEKTSPNFFERLYELHPNLTPSEKRLVAYYYMKLNNREIANLLNISINSLYVVKARLKKKLKIEGDTSFEQYIINEILKA